MTIKQNEYDAIVLSKDEEIDAQTALTRLFGNSPIPESEILSNLGVFLTSKNLGRILFFNEMYKRILDHHGCVMEFGVRWGQNLSILSALRGLYEPFNRHRKLVGFDTFNGFIGVSDKDGLDTSFKDGSFGVAPEYDKFLDAVISCIDDLSPLNHLKKFDLVVGDAQETIPEYMSSHPETIISLAIFDFDIYKPTLTALEQIRSCVSKGSILVFDELADDVFPGETIALKEVFELNKLQIKRLPFASRVSYVQL